MCTSVTQYHRWTAAKRDFKAGLIDVNKVKLSWPLNRPQVCTAVVLHNHPTRPSPKSKSIYSSKQQQPLSHRSKHVSTVL